MKLTACVENPGKLGWPFANNRALVTKLCVKL